MRHALEPMPLVVAALVGALILGAIEKSRRGLLVGAGVGAIVQVSVRLLGVS